MTGPLVTLRRDSGLYRGIVGGLVALGLAIALWLPQYYSSYRVFQFTQVIILAIAALGLNLLTGYNGQISLGHSFFFAGGAYTSAIMIDRWDVHYLLTIPVAAVVTFVLGFLFGIPALRLHGLYLALVTLALAVVAPQIVKKFDEYTGGTQGIVLPRIESPEVLALARDQWLYYLCLAVGIVMFVAARNLVNGSAGRSMIAIRENHLASEASGVHAAAVKARVFAVSAMYAGVAGALYTFVVSFVSPESFTVVMAISFLAAIVVGGLASIAGAIFGAVFIQYVPVWAAELNQALAGVFYGLALIACMFVLPGGVMGLLRRLRARLVRIEGGRALVPSSGPATGSTAEPAGASKEASQDIDERSRV